MQAMQCPMCGFQYSSASEDLKTHQEIHKNVASSYDKMMQKYQGLPHPIRWSGRPKIEDIGTYPHGLTDLTFGSHAPQSVGIFRAK